MRRRVLFISIFAAISILAAKAQSPAPIVVQAASSNSASAATASPPAAQDSEALQAALKSLQEIKAANEETLKKQEAALQQLDELQKAADQVKIFGKRG